VVELSKIVAFMDIVLRDSQYCHLRLAVKGCTVVDWYENFILFFYLY